MANKNKTVSINSDSCTFALVSLFIPPVFVMMGAQYLGWHWGYWESLFIENMITVPLIFAGEGIARQVKKVWHG